MACIVPRFFFINKITSCPNLFKVSKDIFKLGLENITPQLLKSLSTTGYLDYTVGLITNSTGVDQKGRRTVDILRSHGLRVKKIYMIEEDFCAYKKNSNGILRDDQTNIPITLLSESALSLKNFASCFTDIEVLFFDIQDTGMSSSAYLLILNNALKSSVNTKRAFVVLDRPNLLGGIMEGISTALPTTPLVSIPLRHGMTIGELALYCNSLLSAPSAQLHVVSMQHYTRTLFAEGITGFPTLLTNIDTYYGSSFLTSLEYVLPLDVGRGTQHEFTCLTLPDSLRFTKQKWFELRAILKEYSIETAWCHYIHPKKRKAYSGLRLQVRNIESLAPFNVIVRLIQFFKEAGVYLQICPEFYQICGGKKMQNFLEGKFSSHDLMCEVNKGLKAFFNTAYRSFMYKPVPKIMLL